MLRGVLRGVCRGSVVRRGSVVCANQSGPARREVRGGGRVVEKQKSWRSLVRADVVRARGPRRVQEASTGVVDESEPSEGVVQRPEVRVSKVRGHCGVNM